MIVARLIAAIMWNLGTWRLGLPASSLHTMTGSIIGVGLANRLTAPGGSGTSGVDRSQAMGVFRALLSSLVVGSITSGLLLLAMKVVIRNRMFKAPTTNEPPPGWIRGLRNLTCTGISFAHGLNDAQKGTDLIMLILVGSVPTAYALNHAMLNSATAAFLAATASAQKVFDAHAAGATVPIADARCVVTDAVRMRAISGPQTWPDCRRSPVTSAARSASAAS